MAKNVILFIRIMLYAELCDMYVSDHIFPIHVEQSTQQQQTRKAEWSMLFLFTFLAFSLKQPHISELKKNFTIFIFCITKTTKVFLDQQFLLWIMKKVNQRVEVTQ